MKTNTNLLFKIKMEKNLSSLTAAATFALIIVFAACCSKDDPAPPVPELKITSITPSTGGEGTPVVIVGTGFSATASEDAVTLNGKACPVTSATATQLGITIPADAGSGKITVTVGTKSAQSTMFTFVPAVLPLAITSIAPTTGPKQTHVVITGTSFSTTASENIVTLNGKSCEVTNASATQLTVVIPASAGSGNIQVTVGSNTVQSTNFDFVFTVTVSTLAGSTNGFADGTGSDAQFSQPFSVAADANGNIYVADAGNNKIRKVTPAGVVTTLAGSTNGFADGTGDAAQFNYPYGVTTDADGNVYVADTYNHKIRKVTQEGVVTTFAGSTGGYTDATGTDAQFYYLTGINRGADGNFYVADKDNHKIRKVTPAGVVTTLAGSTSGSTDGTGTEAQFNGPYSVATDANNNVYVADASNSTIRKVTSAGVVTTLAGSTGGFADGTGSAAQFQYAYGVATDANGNIYVADTYNHKVRKITSAGVVTTLAGSTGGYADGSDTAAQFNYLTGVATDAAGNIYVADKDNHKIRKIVID
ncbi:MAG TPA: IPT/TIG domain-containing protein [Cyclobacteriaceae bacterium]|nr:IPT/TIG domain-containing protein [Cyclobacteriaceae bacterium]